MIALDVELDGMHPSRIIQLSYLIIDGRRVRGKNMYFKAKAINRYARKVHGLGVYQLKKLSDNGIEFHCQAVLCPGINDGPALEKTISALAALPDDCREILALRESAGLSYDEIAAALSLEVGTVKSRLNRARKKLCAALLESGNFSDRFPSKQGKGCEA